MTCNSSDTNTIPQSPLQSQCDPKKFIKFPRIENIETEFKFPTIEEQKEHGAIIVATEKLDGSNLGVYIPREGIPSFYSRNGLNADGLYNFVNDKNRLKMFIELVQLYLQEKNMQGHWFWGEYFGKGVMNRIKYRAPSGDFRFYDAMPDIKDSHFLRPNEIQDLVNDLSRIAWNHRIYEWSPKLWFLQYFRLPSGEYVTPKDLREFYPLPSRSNFSDDDNREGWVVTMFGPDGFYRRWKMKDEKFRETPIPSSNPEKNLDLINLQTIFKGYLTDARAMGILSKTPERRRIDKLVREFINDAREDFMRDHGEELAKFDDKFKKHVFNAGAEPFLKIKKAIAFESEGRL